MADKLTIKVKDNGRMEKDQPGEPRPSNDPDRPRITVPAGEVVDYCIVVKTNPTCTAWCLQGGALTKVSFPC
jgi:hypothetical protein